MKSVKWVLVIIFILSGVAKLAGLDFEKEAFTRWGYPIWFMYMTGLAETVGAVALLIPRVSMYASAGLFFMMLGAVTTHIIFAEIPMLIIASTVAALLAWLTFKSFTSSKR